MRNYVFIEAGVCLAFLLMVSATGFSAEYAGDFLSLGAGARSLGMGSAFVAISDDASAVYWNAAGVAQLPRREAMAMHAERFGGVVKYDFMSLVTPTERFGGAGVGILRVGVDDIKYTVLEDPADTLSERNRPRVSRIVSAADYALYLSNGRSAGGNLFLGGTVKLIRRKIAENSAGGYGIDLGALYVAPWGASVGVSLRDVTTTAIVWDTGAEDSIRPSVHLGVAYSRAVAVLRGRLIGALNGSAGPDEPDDRINAGFEYRCRDVVALRLGSERGNMTAGMGLRLYGRFALDVAFLGHEELDNTYRVSACAQF